VEGILRDISERKRADEERGRMQAQLVRSDKLASIGTLAAGVAHEINNPLTAIKMNLGSLRDRITDAQARRVLEMQDKAVDRIARIVSGLRAYARADSEAVQPFDVHAVVAETLALIEPLMKKSGHQVETRLASQQPLVAGSPGKLQQVLMNLVTNARDALDEAGQPGRIILETRDLGERFELRVIDDGPGIPAEVLPRIFDPFFTTKPVGKGTGLGLAICHSIVEGMGGALSAESLPGQGACFILELPSTPLPTALGALATASAGKGLSVMVVEDEPDIREALATVLRSRGMRVETAADARAALEALKAHPVELLVTDLRMPGLSGGELMEQVHLLPGMQETRFLVITGQDLVDHPAGARERVAALAHGILYKPFDDKAILQAVDMIFPPG